MLTTMSLELKKLPKKNPIANMYQKGTLYAITINPDDKHQFVDEPDRLEKITKYWTKLLQKYSLEYNLYAEISTPKNSKSFPRYHFHGIISFRTRGHLRRWYNNTYRELSKISYFDIDTIDDILHWQTYCSKNEAIMKTIVDKYHYTSLYPPAMTSNPINKCA